MVTRHLSLMSLNCIFQRQHSMPTGVPVVPLSRRPLLALPAFLWLLMPACWYLLHTTSNSLAERAVPLDELMTAVKPS